MNSSKSAQSALEFLVTYGWAVLASLIIIGAMMYYGLFDGIQLQEDKCDFGPDLKCVDFVLFNDGHIFLKIRNDFGVSINVTAMNSSSDFGDVQCLMPDSNIPFGNISAGQLFDITCKISSTQLSLGNHVNLRMSVQFLRYGSNNEHVMWGEIETKVLPAPSTLCFDTDIIRNSTTDPASMTYYGQSFGYTGAGFTIISDFCEGGGALSEAVCDPGGPAKSTSGCPGVTTCVVGDKVCK